VVDAQNRYDVIGQTSRSDQRNPAHLGLMTCFLLVKAVGCQTEPTLGAAYERVARPVRGVRSVVLRVLGPASQGYCLRAVNLLGVACVTFSAER
jgi:hypothetical protein